VGKRKNSQCEGQLSLFDLEILPAERETPDDLIENLRHKNVYRYRTKTIKAGNLLECEIYPVYTAQEAARAKKSKPSRMDIK
jgi:hypothetical protein